MSRCRTWSTRRRVIDRRAPGRHATASGGPLLNSGRGASATSRRCLSVAGAFAGVLGVLLILGACAVANPDRIPRTNLITGSTGGSWYAIGSAISERTNLGFPGHPITAVPGAGGISNPARVARVPGDLAISFLPFLRAAHRGDPPYRQAYPELRHVATLIENKLHLMVADRLGLVDLDEIRIRRLGVRIAAGPPGSGEEFLLREVLAFYGISYDDIRRWGGRIDLMGTSERADAWRDYHVDLVVFTINEPASIVTELLLTRPSRLWQVPEEVTEALREGWGTRRAEIAAGVYPGHDEPVATVGMPAVVFGTEDVSEEITYALAKMVAEGRDYLLTVHGAFREWQPTDMILNGGVPYHTGAHRYYREQGWLKD